MPLDGFDHCELIISIGHNPGTNHPRMMGTLHEVSRRGVPIIVINPLRERALERFADPQDPLEMATMGATPIASTYLQVKVGGDAAALKGIMKALLEMEAATGGVLDHAFIAAHTMGFEELAADLGATSWESIVAGSGLARAALENVAEAYAASNATIVTYGMGITQHVHGTENVQQIANLLLLRGNFGKRGAGICPLRGHSNVQGNRTVGITEKPSAEMLDGIERTFGFRPAAAHGHDAVAAMQAIVAGTSKALICVGGNLAVAMSDPGAMRRRDARVGAFGASGDQAQSLAFAGGTNDLFVPRAGTYRKRHAGQRPAGGDGRGFNVDGACLARHAAAGVRASALGAGDCCRVGQSNVAGHSRVDWDGMVADYDRIRDAIERVFPEFANYNAGIRVPGGFELPIPPNQLIWKTPTGKAMFQHFKGINEDGQSTGADVLKLTTLRSHDQYNTTIYGLDDRYRGIFGRRDVVFVNAGDLAARGLEHGSVIDVEAAFADGSVARVEGLYRGVL